eukprot:COSAG01_NODE_1422_length_10360_cov_36.853815_8_plen_135_part_00
MFLNRVSRFLNVSMLGTLLYLLDATLLMFQTPRTVGSYGGFLFFSFLNAVQMWHLSTINARYVTFLEQLHTLAHLNQHELADAITLCEKRQLQVVVLGMPMTRGLFAKYLASAAVPLIASSTDYIERFVKGGYL